MFCDRCGAKIGERQKFCASCGRSMAVAPLMPVQTRLAGHMRLLAIFWFAISAFRFIPGLILLALFQRGHGIFPMGGPIFIPALLHALGVLCIIVAALGCVAGWGLLERRSWARMFTIVLAGFNLVDMPFGAALGIYSLWVLLPAQSEQEYRQISRAA